MAPTRLLLLLFLLSVATAAAQPVLDISGNPLQRSSAYHILPAIRGTDGGLRLTSRNASRCPFYVAQAQQEPLDGSFWWIRPADPEANTVQLGADANIRNPGSTTCMQAPVWSLRRIGSRSNLYVVASGAAGNPGATTVNSWFNIQRSESGDYKLVFCPKVCSECRPQCGDLGVFVEEGKRWLGLGGSPFPVVFKKSV